MNLLKCIFLNENTWISLKISLKFIPKVLINSIAVLVQKMACRLPGDKPLSELITFSLLTHICVTRLQWVKYSPLYINFPIMEIVLPIYLVAYKRGTCMYVSENGTVHTPSNKGILYIAASVDLQPVWLPTGCSTGISAKLSVATTWRYLRLSWSRPRWKYLQCNHIT